MNNHDALVRILDLADQLELISPSHCHRLRPILQDRELTLSLLTFLTLTLYLKPSMKATLEVGLSEFEKFSSEFEKFSKKI